MKFHILFYVAALLCLMLALGCASSGRLQYAVNAPTLEEVSIQGLKPKDKIIEVFDTYKNLSAEGKKLWMVVKRNKRFIIGDVDFVSGKVRLHKYLKVYNSDSTLYWTTFEEERLGIGKRLLGGLIGALGATGVTDAYSANAEKIFWGMRDHCIFITYGYARGHKTNFLEAAAQRSMGMGGQLEKETTNANMVGQSFIHGNDTTNIENFNGIQWSIYYDGKQSNMKRSRYYPIRKDGYFVSFHPDLKRKKMVYFHAYELHTKTSWGSSLKFPSEFVDGGVTKDGAWLGVILGKPGQYVLRKYSAHDFSEAIKKI